MDLLASLLPSLPPESLPAYPVVFHLDGIQSRDIQWQSLLELGTWKALRTPAFAVELAIVILSEWNFIRSLSVCSEEKRSFYTVLVMEWKIAFPPCPNSAISGEADCLQRAEATSGGEGLTAQMMAVPRDPEDIKIKTGCVVLFVL